MPVIRLVNLLCTASIRLISFFEVGDHTGLFYCMGLTYVIQALTSIDCGLADSQLRFADHIAAIAQKGHQWANLVK